MENDIDPCWFIRPCTLEDPEGLVATPDIIPALSEDFNRDYPYCLNISSGTAETEQIYGTDQQVYNRQSRAVTLALAEILLANHENPPRMASAFQDCLDHFTRAYPAVSGIYPGIRPDRYRKTLVEGGSQSETFFSYIAVFRYLMAATAGKRESAWENFGLNRYRNYEALYTPLDAPRYLPSVERFKADRRLLDAFIQSMKDEYDEQQRARYEQDSDDSDDADSNPLSPAEREEIRNFRFSQYEQASSFPITKVLRGRLIQSIGTYKDTPELINSCVSEEDYGFLFGEMDRDFARLLAPELLSAQTFLETLFAIQYLFIHVMPYHRGSYAVMGLYRHAMIAYYNHRARVLGRRLLPVVPTRRDYFPDLEALLCCVTEDEFIAASLSTYYCVDYRAYS